MFYRCSVIVLLPTVLGCRLDGTVATAKLFHTKGHNELTINIYVYKFKETQRHIAKHINNHKITMPE